MTGSFVHYRCVTVSGVGPSTCTRLFERRLPACYSKQSLNPASFLPLFSSCEVNCTSRGFSCNFLALAVNQSPQGISCDAFDKHFQPEYASIEMIRMPHVHSNISITAKLGVINSQFYRFLRLCSCKEFFVSHMVSLIQQKLATQVSVFTGLYPL